MEDAAQQELGATKWAIDRRARLVGPDRAKRSLAGFTIGILRLNGKISAPRFRALMRYSALYGEIFGKARIPSAMREYLKETGANRHDEPDEDAERELAAKGVQLGEATTLLRSLRTDQPYRVTLRYAVYDEPLRFMSDDRREGNPVDDLADLQDIRELNDAANALAVFWGFDGDRQSRHKLEMSVRRRRQHERGARLADGRGEALAKLWEIERGK